MSAQQRESTPTEPNSQLADLQAAIEALQGHVFALELIVGAALVYVTGGRGKAIVTIVEDLPARIRERPGLDARPFFQDGIEKTVANVVKQLLELSNHVHASQSTTPH